MRRHRVIVRCSRRPAQPHRWRVTHRRRTSASCSTMGISWFFDHGGGHAMAPFLICVAVIIVVLGGTVVKDIRDFKERVPRSRRGLPGPLQAGHRPAGRAQGAADRRRALRRRYERVHPSMTFVEDIGADRRRPADECADAGAPPRRPRSTPPTTMNSRRSAASRRDCFGEFWVRRGVDFDAVYCGPQLRQRHTAEIWPAPSAARAGRR